MQGIPSEKAKIIVAAIKDSKKKAQASIQGDTVRVVSKDRDVLQEVMALLRGKDIGVELQFTQLSLQLTRAHSHSHWQAVPPCQFAIPLLISTFSLNFSS